MKSSLWVWKMAWLESRSSRKRLLLFLLPITFGIAALVAIHSLGHNLSTAMDWEAKLLLGADLALRSQHRFTEGAENLVDSIPGVRSRQISFLSMAFFPKDRKTRLVQVRALEGEFPYYGTLETEPVSASRDFKKGPRALVDQNLMLQFDASVGDSIRLGEASFRIAGKLKSIPGEAVVGSLTGPRVYIPMTHLDETELIQTGSRADYTVFFKFGELTDVAALIEEIRPDLTTHQLQPVTVEQRKALWERIFRNFDFFLNLIGLAALLLGGIGVASSVHLYIKQKTDTIVTLRCLGAPARKILWIYLIQAAAMGLIGTLLGTLLGLGVQVILPTVLKDFLPFKVPFSLSSGTLAEALLVGFGIAWLTALLPLLPIRKVSPLWALRSEYEENISGAKDPLQGLVYLLLTGTIFVFIVRQNTHWTQALSIFAALIFIFGLLATLARLLMVLAKKSLPLFWSYLWRQGLANLYRPHNQTVVMVLSLGLATFLMVTLYLTHSLLIKQVSITHGDDQPNLVLFDIQSDQKKAVTHLLLSFNLPVLQDVSIVTMRLAAINGQSVEEIRHDSKFSAPRWALFREYRSTYRDSLADTEKIVAGKWPGKRAGGSKPVPISVEESIAENLNIGPGDTLEFDVQGVRIRTRISSIRRVDWQRVQTNFFFVFPTGVLENAPQSHVLASHASSPRVSAEFQRSLVQEFPGVSAIDLSLVLNTIETLFNKVSSVIRFMTLFSVFTGLIVLAATIVAGRYQRLKESVLLRTLGASRRQILRIMTAEYFFLGTFSVVGGVLIALLASSLLAYFAFDSVLAPSPGPIAAALLTVLGLSILIGWVNTWGIFNRPPLETLRKET